MTAPLELPLPEPEEEAPKVRRSLEEQMRERYPLDSYALFWEVRDATGTDGQGRSADAVAMSLWPSRGLELLGFEVKSARSDWLRELKEPRKAEAICKHCDRWFVVATDAKVVHKNEVPAAWGLLVSNGEKLRQVIPAPLLGEPRLGRKVLPDVSRQFVASLLRQAQKTAARPLDQLREVARNEAHRELTEKHKAAIAKLHEEVKRVAETAESTIRNFERESGIDIRRNWEHGRIGRIVQLLLSQTGSEAQRWGRPAETLKDAAATLERLAAQTREAAAEAAKLDERWPRAGGPGGE